MKFSIALSVLMALAGLILLFLPVGASVSGQSIGCGSAASEDYSRAVNSQDLSRELILYGSQDPTLEQLYGAGLEAGANAYSAQQIQTACDSAVTNRRTISIVLLAFGVLAGAILIGVDRSNKRGRSVYLVRR